MWQERADYGHFFYRIPNGESAADAYDRVSGFNESLWRSFGEADFPSVCVLVTHGLMTRVFLMKWYVAAYGSDDTWAALTQRRYHWSVEYFEDLRNVNHCEFIIMDKDIDNGKFLLKSELRTWSELKKQRAIEAAKEESSRDESHQPQSPVIDPKRRNTVSQFLPNNQTMATPPPARKWGGCVAGCDHKHDKYPRRRKLQALAEDSTAQPVDDGKSPYAGEDHPIAHQEDAAPLDELSVSPTNTRTLPIRPGKTPAQMFAEHYTDGVETPHERNSSDRERDGGDYFDPTSILGSASGHSSGSARMAGAKKAPRRRPTEEDLERWANESGMGSGKRADALGDEPENGEDSEDLDVLEAKDKSLRGSVY